MNGDDQKHIEKKPGKLIVMKRDGKTLLPRSGQGCPTTILL